MQKEIWDVYDRHKQQTGKTIARGDALKPGDYHLVIHVCYFNHQNQMLIQKRSAHKTWGGLWDISIGGAVQSKESSQDAATRESYEELGITHDFTNVLPNITMTFERGFDDIFIACKNISIDDITFMDHEACDAKWATETEIIHLIKTNQFLPIHSIPFIKHVFSLHTT